MAEDFANIFDDEDDVLMEANQGNNPAKHIPLAREKHRAPKKRFTTKPPGTAPPRKSKKSEEKCDESALQAKLTMAMEVTDSELTTGRKNKIENPPMVVHSSWRIAKCRGCKKGITQQDKEFPHSFVIRRRGVIGYSTSYTTNELTVSRTYIFISAWLLYGNTIRALRRLRIYHEDEVFRKHLPAKDK